MRDRGRQKSASMCWYNTCYMKLIWLHVYVNVYGRSSSWPCGYVCGYARHYPRSDACCESNEYAHAR